LLELYSIRRKSGILFSFQTCLGIFIRSQSFKFGNIYTPELYISKELNINETQIEDQVMVALSPSKTEDADFDSKDTKPFLESKINSIGRRPVGKDFMNEPPSKNVSR